VKARTWWLILLTGIVLTGAVGLAWLRGSTWGRRAELASGYVAHVVCSCRYGGGRDMASCATDFEPGMEMVKMSDDPAAKRITAWVPLVAQRSAYFEPGYGCRLDEKK
jgi:hypothetical protein